MLRHMIAVLRANKHNTKLGIVQVYRGQQGLATVFVNVADVPTVSGYALLSGSGSGSGYIHRRCQSMAINVTEQGEPKNCFYKRSPHQLQSSMFIKIVLFLLLLCERFCFLFSFFISSN